VRIFFDNLIDAAGVVLTPSSEISTLPAENVIHPFRKKPWRTGTSTAAETLVFDLLTAQAVTAIILLDHTLTNADTLIKIEGNAADVWGAPSFSQALTWASGTIAAVFASQSYRYWRLSFTKSAAGETRDIGRIFLGTYYSAEEQPDFDGYGDELIDPSREQTTPGGQSYVEALEQFSEVRCTFSRCPNSQVESLRTIAEAVGQQVAFFLQVDTTTPTDKIWYVKLKRPFEREASGWDLTGAIAWDVSLELKEQR
jgi:hypothetical protein